MKQREGGKNRSFKSKPTFLAKRRLPFQISAWHCPLRQTGGRGTGVRLWKIHIRSQEMISNSLFHLNKYSKALKRRTHLPVESALFNDLLLIYYIIDFLFIDGGYFGCLHTVSSDRLVNLFYFPRYTEFLRDL